MPVPSIEQIETLAGEALGAQVRVLGSEHLAPWCVLRCGIEGAAPGSLIVKWLRDGAARSDPSQMATEAAALEFLAEIGFPHAPRLVAADLASGLVILEDLSPRTPLADLIRARGLEAATPGLLAFARATGELASATVGKSQDYDAIRRRHGDIDPMAARSFGLGPRWSGARRTLDGLGLVLPPAVEAELADIVEALREPGPFLALTNGDPEANNFMVGDGQGGQLIDFEGAAYRHALTAATWIHVPGPAWITVCGPLGMELEEIYRAALAQSVPEAADDGLFGFGMSAACLAMAFNRLDRFSILDARQPGDTSRVQMVATLEAAAGAARRHRALPYAAAWAEAAAQWLRRRWSDADVDLGSYLPYTSR